MEIHVACDICGHRYVLPGDREGRNAKCKSCGVSFALDSDNFHDPATSELDEIEENDGQRQSSLTSFRDIATKFGHALAGLVTLSMLVWMTSLLFRSPQEAIAQNAQPGAKAMNQLHLHGSRRRLDVAPGVVRPGLAGKRHQLSDDAADGI